MISGIVNVYKEKGFTSFDVVAKMRGIYHQKKIGHTGTLDPDAEGVLPVCLGKATKVCDLLTDKDKEYEAVLLLGQDTDTQDISGTVLASAPVEVSEDAVREAILSFVGEYNQIPPMYSALKVQGQKLCDLARKGITVERQPRRVHIYDIQILEMELPRVRIHVTCSKGTYIRTLCKDVGDKLGCYGCMEKLLRTRVAEFSLENAHHLCEIEKNPEAFVQPVDVVFGQYEKRIASRNAGKYIENGNRISGIFMLNRPESADHGTFRIYDESDSFLGLYEYLADTDEYKPIKLFME
ncbi:MAG: tRNA pseudouridine(55) synthase TruB [Lachnospiraceae bacterium]|nr:tRNA pseudouridine(55) synthase TruB [Lachnospiraceae bacterium]